MNSFATALAAAAVAAGLSLSAPGASAAPLGAGPAVVLESRPLVAPVQWGWDDDDGYYERRRVYRYDDRYDRRSYVPDHSRGRGNAYGRRDRDEARRDRDEGRRGRDEARRNRDEARRPNDSGYRGQPGVVFGPGGRGDERCSVDSAGRKVCR